MKFLISQELMQGRYFVKVALQEFSEDDQKKANIFGMPTLRIRLENGNYIIAPINLIFKFPAYGFQDPKEADDYAIRLKNEINHIKEGWATLEDKWSKQEVI